MSIKPVRSLCFPLAGAALAIGLLAACQTASTDEAESTKIAAPKLPGEAIAAQLCATCHAISREGASPHPDALPFRQISLRYPVRDLEESLGEGIVVGHADMPTFQLDPSEIDHLLTYLEAIQDPV